MDDKFPSSSSSSSHTRNTIVFHQISIDIFVSSMISVLFSSVLLIHGRRLLKWPPCNPSTAMVVDANGDIATRAPPAVIGPHTYGPHTWPCLTVTRTNRELVGFERYGIVATERHATIRRSTMRLTYLDDRLKLHVGGQMTITGPGRSVESRPGDFRTAQASRRRTHEKIASNKCHSRCVVYKREHANRPIECCHLQLISAVRLWGRYRDCLCLCHAV